MNPEFDSININQEDIERRENMDDIHTQVQQEEVQAEEALLAESEDQGFLPNNPLQLATEATSALVGGAADAVESVGGFLDLSGDTIKHALGKTFGNPVDETENPWSNQYESNNPIDIPDEWIPENRSGLGKLARGLAEFGFLTAATGGVGGAAFGSARVGLRVAATARATGIGIKTAITDPKTGIKFNIKVKVPKINASSMPKNQ